jgi:Fe-S cluster biosynthesis and repair protein YggX
VLIARRARVQFMGELLPNDGDLMRRSWHAVPRELWGRWLLLDTARSDDRHLQRTDWEARNFILWQLLCGKRTR